jgi:transcriptional regulator with XRE-family HTH domain
MGRKKSQKNPSFAKQLKSLMEMKGLTQEAMAKMAGVSQQTVSKWLQGFHPTLTGLSQLASANAVPESFFLEVTPDPKRSEFIKLNLESQELPQVVNAFSVHQIKQASLDNAPSPPYPTVEVKITSLPELIAKLREFTKARGKKAMVAKACGVSRQAVDQWMREKDPTKPSADAVFALLSVLQGKGKK